MADYHVCMVVHQREIAKQLNLSPATVSRCLRHDPRIPEDTRRRVFAVASEIGYRSRRRDARPSRSAEMTSAGLHELCRICALVQSDGSRETENAFNTLGGIGKAAQNNRASLMLEYVSLDRRGQIHLPKYQPETLAGGKVDGVILINTFERDSVASLAQQIPCVSIDIQYPGVRIDCVGEENVASMAKVVDHLVALGHRRMGYIDLGYCDEQVNSISRERLGGFIAAMSQHSLCVEPSHICFSRGQSQFGEPIGLDFLQTWIRDGVTALVCLNDYVAVRVLRWLKDHGISCPGQVSVTGFDANAVPSDLPLLTSVRVQFQDLGRLAVERLIARLREPVLPAVRLLLDTELVVGRTTGPAIA